MAISPLIRFWLYLIFIIPSIFCSIFTLYYYISDRVLRKTISNHVMIIIIGLSLLYNLTDLVWLMDFYRNGVTFSSARFFCLFWTYIDFSVFISLSYFVAWASIERHILIFHQNLVSTKFKRFLFHYLPMMIFGLYPIIYYLIVLFFLPCPLAVNNKRTRCGLTNCAYENQSPGIWDGIVNNILPIFSIMVFSAALILRVWYQKHRMGQRFQWKKYRKMTIQLLSVSSIYLVFLFPPMLLLTAYAAGLSSSIGSDFYSASLYLSYLITPLLPIVSTFSLPELRTKFYRITRMQLRSTRTIAPHILTTNPFAGSRTPAVLPTIQ